MMKKKQQPFKEERIEKSTNEIVLEVLGHGSGYSKSLGYGPKPTSRRNNANSFMTEQLQKQLHETKQKLHISESQVGELKTKYKILINVEKLMAFMATQGVTL
ncbi:unnamed protein product [Cuscuta epithymum]|uniref:Uncharacterized protein n=1 Tax=Cuscuta epithymum TaxID=186058 RepID=A0AAV0FRZ3_9ASTE|nr:unnamed protein product [Cuscuta epithymum]